jgi:hypothetical protein
MLVWSLSISRHECLSFTGRVGKYECGRELRMRRHLGVAAFGKYETSLFILTAVK